MITLEPLCTMTLHVTTPLDAGAAPAGRRMIAEIAAAQLTGRLSGRLAGTSSADWFTMTASGLGLPDVRLSIETHDGALILIRYFGRIRLIPQQPSTAIVAPVFETGDPRYDWLNDIQAAGKGIFTADRSRLDYELYELR
ncbi:DUF3237 domain-containing protein [Nocardia sp. NPDC051900]|uniref:DUF3237 domain-containing protein n=1 Tax=Nocardia sp. NPDC051900 TaxID=3364326 RepID=UPI0037A6DA89